MSNKDIITRVKVLPIYELDAIGKYLENMAEQGLFLVKHSRMYWKFRKAEPRKVHYYVDVFDKATMFDTRPEAETIDYIEYCKSCGWEHILTEGKLQFFISYDENPIDIQTDSEQRLNSIHKMSRGSAIITPIILIAIAVEMLLSTIVFSNKPFAIMNRMDVLTCAVWSISGIVNVFNMLSYLTFYFKNKVRIKNDEPMHFNSLKKASTVNSVAVLSVIMLLIGISSMLNKTMGLVVLVSVFTVLIVSLISAKFYNSNYSRAENKRRYIIFVIVTIVVCLSLLQTIVISALPVDGGSHRETIKQGDNIVTYDNYEIPYNFENAGIDVSNAIVVERFADEDKLLTGNVCYYNSTAYADIDFMNVVDNISYSIAKFNKPKYNEKYIEYEYVDSCVEEPELAEKWNANKVYKYVEDTEDFSYDYMVCYDNYTIKISENLKDKTELINILK